MKLTRTLFLVAVFGMLGSLDANTTGLTKDTVLTNPSLCIPCTQYCKTHPNSPRCL